MSNQYYNYEDDCGCNSRCDSDRRHEGHRKDECDSKKDFRVNPPMFRCRNTSATVINSVNPVTVASIRSPKLDCFKRPVVKLDFSTLANIPVDVAANTLIVNVYRQDHMFNEPPIKSITIPIPAIAAGGVPQTLPIVLSLCDDEDLCYRRHCPGYRVTMQLGTDVATTVNIPSGAISLIAGDEC